MSVISKTPGIWAVLCQLRRDLFGKDVENSATYTYDWLADQVGHFTLGFLGTFLLFWFNSSIYNVWPGATGATGWTWAILICGIFVIIEALDYLSQWLTYQKSSQVFKFNGLEVLFNTFTAVYYIALGAVVAAFGSSDRASGFWAFLGSAVFFIALAIWWLERKICFQQAGLPVYARLPFFKNIMPPPTAQFIANLSRPAPASAQRGTTGHLIIAGPLSSGKSTLAAAIGTEFAVRTRMGIGRYTTLSKLLQAIDAAAQGDDKEPDDGRILWPWQTSDLLIIDDVDFLSPNSPGTRTSSNNEQEIAKAITDMIISKIPDDLRTELKYRRTVWVIGNVEDGALDRWREMLATVIEIEPETITVCRFEQKLRELDKNRDRPDKNQRVKV